MQYRNDSKIKCRKCGWSWQRSKGGLDPFKCHKCDYNNKNMYSEKIAGLGALPKMKKVEFWAKEWFQKSGGNSYFVVKVYVNDKIVGTSQVRYGYGSAYEEEGMKILKKAGYLRGVKAIMPSRYFRERAGVKYTGSINSVKRERDLKDFANS